MLEQVQSPETIPYSDNIGLWYLLWLSYHIGQWVFRGNDKTNLFHSNTYGKYKIMQSVIHKYTCVFYNKFIDENSQTVIHIHCLKIELLQANATGNTCR